MDVYDGRQSGRNYPFRHTVCSAGSNLINMILAEGHQMQPGESIIAPMRVSVSLGLAS
jgi:hypothetical protein